MKKLRLHRRVIEPDIGTQSSPSERAAMMRQAAWMVISKIVYRQCFAELGIAFLPETKVTAASQEDVTLEAGGRSQTREFDTIVVAGGIDLISEPGQAERYRHAGATVLAVGECGGHTGIIGATRSGHRAACRI